MNYMNATSLKISNDLIPDLIPDIKKPLNEHDEDFEDQEDEEEEENY